MEALGEGAKGEKGDRRKREGEKGGEGTYPKQMARLAAFILFAEACSCTPFRCCVRALVVFPASAWVKIQYVGGRDLRVSKHGGWRNSGPASC